MCAKSKKNMCAKLNLSKKYEINTFLRNFIINFFIFRNKVSFSILENMFEKFFNRKIVV